MTVWDGVGRVPQQHGFRLLEPVAEGAGIDAMPDGFPVDERGDGGAAVPHSLAAAGGLSDAALQRCADICADAGFLVVLIRNERGTYLNAS
jgi:hypothetical protein